MKIKRKVDARISDYIGVDPKIIDCVIVNAAQKNLEKVLKTKLMYGIIFNCKTIFGKLM